MKDIPKDGNTYLTWHPAEGLGFVKWSMGDECFYFHSEPSVYKVVTETCKSFTGWMNQFGKWNQIDQAEDQI